MYTSSQICYLGLKQVPDPKRENLVETLLWKGIGVQAGYGYFRYALKYGRNQAIAKMILEYTGMGSRLIEDEVVEVVKKFTENKDIADRDWLLGRIERMNFGPEGISN